ncbi:MAG: DUF4842 domain-containing protein [Muribaculaceae bacterium]|nr:DUF4842 domain-containing protein [Muribaculaceae bacterium]
MLNKLNKNLYLMCAAMAMGIASSCTSDAPEIPAEELYTREWVKNFGVMDATQDWNNATRGSVQVDVKGGPKRVRVTTVIDDVTYLLADYPEVSGVQKLEFDIPRGLTDIKVMTANRAIRTQVGGSATFAETANNAAAAPADGTDYIWNENGIKISTGSYLISDPKEPTHYRDKLPEDEFNVGKVPTNFEFTSNGSFVVYPIYWDTRNVNTVGVYTVDETTGDISHYPFYTIKSGDYLQYCDYLGGKAPKTYRYRLDEYSYQWRAWLGITDWQFQISDLTEEDFVTIKDKYFETNCGDTWTKEHFGLTSNDEIGEIVIVSKPGDEGNDGTYIEFEAYTSERWVSPASNKEESYDENIEDSYIAWRSMGFKIDIEEGIKFGMYIENGDGFFYSQAELNEEKTVEGNTFNIPHASTYIHHCTNMAGQYHEYRVLAFEDWKNDWITNGPDLNDVVLYITSDNVEEIPDVEDHDADPIKWLIAAEDLGSVDDFDFNDVVFEVEHAAGRLVATIRPLAAGGTLETYLCRNGQRVNNREWHSLFGHSHTTMVNTGRATGRASTFTIDVPADFTLTSSSAGSGSIHENYKQNMGGFSIEVVREDGRVSTIEAPGVGTAPQMILIFQKDDNKWRWPVERVNIKSAYPRFESWMNPSTGFSLDTDGDNWFDFPTSVAGSLFNR